MNKDYQFPEIDRSSFKPIYAQVADMLISYASENDLKPGDPLPSENQLLSLLGVSRNSVRLAMDKLVKIDFAVKRQGQGTFIKQQEHCVNLDFSQGFEGTLYKLGIRTENILIEKAEVVNPADWMEGLTSINGDGLKILIKRIKKIKNEIIALEERVLPEYVVNRYSDKELGQENVNPNLLERYPDTYNMRFKYYFSVHTLQQNEAEILGKESGAVLLQRVGEYFNLAGECVMHGRHIFVSSKIKVSYEFARGEKYWYLT